ncbi:hypothetical protein CLOM_g723 [Closterium sp. NIES-68]|nr:hypothetical protein CLOM_g723 [Closterium sp. NIES-68]
MDNTGRSTDGHVALDPHSHWSLGDLNRELDTIQRRTGPVPAKIRPRNAAGADSKGSRRLQTGSAGTAAAPAAFGNGAFGAVPCWPAESGGSARSPARSAPRSPAWMTARRGSASSSCSSEEEREETGEGNSGGKEDLFYYSPVARPVRRVEAELGEVERKLAAEVEEELRQRRLSLERRLHEERVKGQAAMEEVQVQRGVVEAMLDRLDREHWKAMEEMRDSHIRRLSQEHEQKSEAGETQLRREAAAAEARRRAEIEAEVRAKLQKEMEEERRREEQERRRREEEERRTEEERRREMERQQRELEATRKAAQAEKAAADAADARAAAEAKAAAARAAVEAKKKQAQRSSKVRVAEGAAREAEARLARLKAMRDEIAPIMADNARKKDRKAVERRIILLVQQISATHDQIAKKSADLVALLLDPSLPQPFVAITFASKILSQCESQVTKLPPFAFALAQVIVNVASRAPIAMEALIGSFNEVCIYTIPQHYVFSEASYPSDEAYYRDLGYREEDGEGGKKRMESTDAFIERMTGYIILMAAICQTIPPPGTAQHPFGLSHAWQWCARLLNHLPANRASATALEVFLKIAGYRMHLTYRSQFLKLLDVVGNEYRGKLQALNDPDVSPVVNRIETYVGVQRYLKPPEGLEMPLHDKSSQLRA